jgi:hypothetical protein
MSVQTLETPPDRKWHPVWEVYDELRTARLNTKYYSCVLARCIRLNFWTEFIIAASASTGVAGAWFFETADGQLAWKILGSIAAILSVYQTIARPSEEIRCLEQRVTSYRELELSFDAIRRRVESEHDYSKSSKRLFEAAIDQKQRLVTSYVDPNQRHELIHECFDEVLKELPSSHFYIPPGENSEPPKG